MKMVVVALSLLFCGCTTLASREVFVGCQALDMATTVRALHLSPTAYEQNPVPLPLLFAFKIALSWWVWNSGWNEDKESKNVRALAGIISCAPIPGNLAAARK